MQYRPMCAMPSGHALGAPPSLSSAPADVEGDAEAASAADVEAVAEAGSTPPSLGSGAFDAAGVVATEADGSAVVATMGAIGAGCFSLHAATEARRHAATRARGEGAKVMMKLGRSNVTRAVAYSVVDA